MKLRVESKGMFFTVDKEPLATTKVHSLVAEIARQIIIYSPYSHATSITPEENEKLHTKKRRVRQPM